MVGKGSPRFNMSGSPKVRRYMPPPSATKKKPSPKCNGAKKSGCSPREKQRADWNPTLERSLVEILHEYKDSGYRGGNGWNSEGWSKMLKEFHMRNNYVSYTKAQIQDKEGQLKRDYKMLKAARQQSGSSWNEKMNMVEGPPAMWANLMVTFPKIKKFNNNKATFPLYDALGELYDGHLAEGNYNVTSLQAPQEKEPLEQFQDDEDEEQEEEALEVHDEIDDALKERNEEVLQGRDEESETPAIERSGQRRPAVSRINKPEKELKKPRKSENIERMMGAYLEMRTKQAEDEAIREREAREREEREKKEAREREEREKEAAQSTDFSIKRCISAISKMEVTKEEKAKAYSVFKDPDNRQNFLSACKDDSESALIWLRNEMA